MQLEGEGLVEIEPRRGAIVRAFARADLVELYELRALLEPYAAAPARAERIGAGRRSPRCEEICARGRGARAATSTTRSRWNEEFHRDRHRGRRQPAADGRAARRRRASRACFRTAFWRDERQRALSQTCHRELVSRARRGRTPSVAEAVMRMHILRRQGVPRSRSRRDGALTCPRPLTRPPRDRVRPAARRPVRRHAARRLRRRRRQGRGAARAATRCASGAGCATTATRSGGRSSSRNKRSVSLNLREPRGQELAPRLCAEADVVRRELPPRHDGEVGPRPRAGARASPRLHLRARVRLRPDRPLPRPRRASPPAARRSPACATSTATRARRRRAAASRSATRSPRSRRSRASCSRSTRATRAARPARSSTPRSPTPASR